MLEVFALPYFVISGVIGWVIFEPLLRVDDSDGLSPADLAVTDLLAISVPASVLFLFASWMMPESLDSLLVQLMVIAIALLFAMFGLIAGLFLLPKTFQVTFLQRMAVVGIIAPLGIVLTVGWVAILIWPCAYSMLYLAPSAIAVAAATSGLRILAVWVCQAESETVETAANPPI